MKIAAHTFYVPNTLVKTSRDIVVLANPFWMQQTVCSVYLATTFYDFFFFNLSAILTFLKSQKTNALV